MSEPPTPRTATAPLVIARVGELRPGQTKKFAFAVGTEEVEGFVLNFEGRLHAYVNRCCHVPLSLDWIDNQFFSEDGAHVVCATHGARYRPDTGECISGPPLGKLLIRVPLVVEGDAIVATLPDSQAPPRLEPGP